MATAQGQDIICCQLCSDPVKHYCNLCRVNLCSSCIPKHMADESRKHEIVGYSYRKRTSFVLPTCPLHEKKDCEAYCQHCKTSICVTCLIDSNKDHKDHSVIKMNDILQEKEQKIRADIKHMENSMISKYNIATLSTITGKFDEVLSIIENRKDEICKAVYSTSNNLKDLVSKQKEEAVKKYEESQDKRNNAQKEFKEIIQNTKDILSSKDATAIIDYQPTSNLDFQSPELPKFPCLDLRPELLKQDEIEHMFGYQTHMQKMIEITTRRPPKARGIPRGYFKVYKTKE
ncbi:E3 ubiquitin-protein ligase TRIM36-like [Saccostrea cucullata]|uniref:E3 ubiquitin-protein ligase TRIM36-like n=1 Tax=Saccostrea cuccullata TaxID=36930 RepID=UPI002ED43B25